MGLLLKQKVQNGFAIGPQVGAMFYNATEHILDNLDVWGGHIERDGLNWTIVLDEFIDTDGTPAAQATINFAFRVDVSGTTATLANGGTVRIAGVGDFSLAGGASVTLSGDPEWVYLSMPATGGTITLKHSSTEPTSSSSNLALPLVKYVLSGGNYVEDKVCHRGDFYFASILP